LFTVRVVVVRMMRLTDIEKTSYGREKDPSNGLDGFV